MVGLDLGTCLEHELCPLSLNLTQFVALAEGGIIKIPSMRTAAWCGHNMS